MLEELNNLEKGFTLLSFRAKLCYGIKNIFVPPISSNETAESALSTTFSLASVSSRNQSIKIK